MHVRVYIEFKVVCRSQHECSTDMQVKKIMIDYDLFPILTQWATAVNKRDNFFICVV